MKSRSQKPTRKREVRNRDQRLRERLPLLENLPQEVRDIFVEFLDALLKADELTRRTKEQDERKR